jgi:hypothetical protein
VRRWAPLLAWAIAACANGKVEGRSALHAPRGASLVGAWDAELSLTRPYPLEHGDPPARRICGTMGFVENHYATGATAKAASHPHVGVYDLDLRALGLDWLGDKAFPIAVVSGVDREARSATMLDSVAITLNPGGSERIVLLGRYDVQGIDGEWTAQSLRGTATGSFSLRKHTSAPQAPSSC